jgi:RHS repeat-associated protein
VVTYWIHNTGTSEHYAYDTRSRLTQVQLKQGATVLRTTGYAWDNADQITRQTVNGVTTNYGYDLAGQLTSEVRSGYNVAYTYDANGNRTSKTVNGAVESYTYDLGDKMLTAGAKSYTYDAAGRTVGINAPGGTTTLTYDYESRVTAISGPGINETHAYNGLDTRVGTVQGGVSRTFVRDGSYVTDPVLRDGQATYTPGVSERRGGVSAWSHSGLKNADAQTTSVGAIAATRVYDAFGAELSATGTWKGPFGYAGGFGYQEDSSGLKLLGHRYYDPTTGRFLSRDPIRDGQNWYTYCEGEPIRKVDVNGLDSLTIYKNPGGFGLGSHVIIGLDDGNNERHYGFYPTPAGGPSRKNAGKGQGAVRVNDRPKPNADSYVIPITPDERRRLLRLIMESRQAYILGDAPEYNVNGNNCVNWVAMIVYEAFKDSLTIDRLKDKRGVPEDPSHLWNWLNTAFAQEGG